MTTTQRAAAGLRLLKSDTLVASDPSSSGLLPRGVHRAPYLEQGKPVLLAVADDGNLLKRAIIEPGWEFDVACELVRVIEAYDDERRRAIVRVIR